MSLHRSPCFLPAQHAAPDFDELPPDLLAGFGVTGEIPARHPRRPLGVELASHSPSRGSALIADPPNDVWISVASIGEIAIKQRLGKLSLPAESGSWLPPALEATRINHLDIRPAHAYAAAALPEHYRDPFDRMIIAEAREEGLAVMTRDERFRRYEVTVVAA